MAISAIGLLSDYPKNLSHKKSNDTVIVTYEVMSAMIGKNSLRYKNYNNHDSIR